MASTPISVAVAVLTPDENREIHFGVSRTCKADGTATWTIDFTLNVRRNGEMKPRATVHVTIGEQLAQKAELLAAGKQELSPAKVSLLENQIADRAATLSKKKINSDTTLRDLLLQLL